MPNSRAAACSRRAAASTSERSPSGTSSANSSPPQRANRDEQVLERHQSLRPFPLVQVLALEVLDQHQGSRFLWRDLAHQGRDCRQSRPLRRPPAPLPCDQHVSRAVRRHQHRLEDTMLADGVGELRPPARCCGSAGPDGREGRERPRTVRVRPQPAWALPAEEREHILGVLHSEPQGMAEARAEVLVEPAQPGREGLLLLRRRRVHVPVEPRFRVYDS
jgi:hypothetical protein